MARRPPEEYGDRIADVYDDLYTSERFATDDAVARLVELAAGGPVLELGIGTGRIALPLAAAGVEVRGIDASQAMVDRLWAKPGGTDIAVEIGDFGAADLGTDLALVFVAFNTFFALQEQERQIDCFRAAHAALRPGGRFAVEGFVPDLGRFDRGQRTSMVEVTPQRTVLDATVHHAATQQIDSNHIVIADGKVDTYPTSLRYVWPAEFDLMGRLAGFEHEHRWGGWDGSPFTAESPRHVTVWRRP